MSCTAVALNPRSWKTCSPVSKSCSRTFGFTILIWPVISLLLRPTSKGRNLQWLRPSPCNGGGLKEGWGSHGSQRIRRAARNPSVKPPPHLHRLSTDCVNDWKSNPYDRPFNSDLCRDKALAAQTLVVAVEFGHLRGSVIASSSVFVCVVLPSNKTSVDIDKYRETVTTLPLVIVVFWR